MKSAILACFVSLGAMSKPLKSRQDTDNNPLCFNTCFGINSTIADAAIETYCQKYDNVAISWNHANGFSNTIQYPLGYAPQPGTDEQGEVDMRMDAVEDEDCPSIMSIDYLTCKYNFYVPVNQCNTGGDKQGGYWTAPCVSFTFNPHPRGC